MSMTGEFLTNLSFLFQLWHFQPKLGCLGWNCSGFVIILVRNIHSSGWVGLAEKKRLAKAAQHLHLVLVWLRLASGLGGSATSHDSRILAFVQDKLHCLDDSASFVCWK